MAAIEELWEATYLPATLLNFQEPQDAQYSPDGPDNGSSLSEEDYVEMFTEIPSSEDFLDIDVLAEETEENSQEGVEITYVYEQDMVNALNSALNSALANFNILNTDNLFLDTYSSDICIADVTNSWESWIEDVTADEEISQLDSEIQCLEEELAALKHERCLLQTTAPQYLYSCLYSPLQEESPVPSPIKRKIEEIEEEDYTSEEEICIEEQEEADDEASSSSDESSEEDESDSSSSDSEEDSEDSSDSDSSSSSSDESSEDESEEEDKKTIYIPYKKRRKVPISIFRQNRIKLIKTEESDCEEDVDILN